MLLASWARFLGVLVAVADGLVVGWLLAAATLLLFSGTRRGWGVPLGLEWVSWTLLGFFGLLRSSLISNCFYLLSFINYFCVFAG